MKCDESILGSRVENSVEMDVETAQNNPSLDTKQCDMRDIPNESVQTNTTLACKKKKNLWNEKLKSSEDGSKKNVVDSGSSFVESPLPLERDSSVQPPLQCLAVVDFSAEASVRDSTDSCNTDNDFQEGGLVNSIHFNKEVLISGSFSKQEKLDSTKANENYEPTTVGSSSSDSKMKDDNSTDSSVIPPENDKMNQRRTQEQSNTYMKRRKLSDSSSCRLEPIKEDEITQIPGSGSTEQENIYITVQDAALRDKVINESTSNDNENFGNETSQCHPSCKLLEQKNAHTENSEETKHSGSKLTPVVKHDVDLIITNKGNAPQGPLSSPERTLVCRSSKKLLILDVNGLLADIVPSASYLYAPDIIISGKEVFKRPFCKDFLKFCFERFNVGVWSSRTRRNVDLVLNFLMGDLTGKLLFCWDQSHCTDTGFKTITHKDKPLLLKELKKLWEKHEHDLPWEKGEYDESNTLLLDDSPYKALRNPAHTAIFPRTYRYNDTKDCSLGPAGDLRLYLERLATSCENVQDYVKQNPFGQRSITESNLSWSFYRKIVSNEHEEIMEQSSAVTEVEK